VNRLSPDSPHVHATPFGVGGVGMLVRRSLRRHAVSTLVTALAAALATGLSMSVFAIEAQTRKAFTGGTLGFDAVLGARGSPLQLVLNTVYHLETSPGNIPWSLYEEIRKEPLVAEAVPYFVGDNYRGFRIVGTTRAIFEAESKQGQGLRTAPGGRPFDEQSMEAVVGSFVAAQTGLRVGSRFNPYHGVTFNPDEKHEQEYVVVGVLEPTNSPSDRAIWIPIEGGFRMGGHMLLGTGKPYLPMAGVEIPDEHKEVSAVMLRLRGPTAGLDLSNRINRQGKVATLAWPIGAVMSELFNKMGWLSRVLQLVAYMVVFVSAAAILAAIYNTISERRREFAILRALGARRSVVFAAIVTECASIAALGSLLGFLVYAGVLGVAYSVLRTQVGVVLDVLAFHPALLLAPAGMIALGALVGVIPAVRAYRTDVATHLTPHS